MDYKAILRAAFERHQEHLESLGLKAETDLDRRNARNLKAWRTKMQFQAPPASPSVSSPDAGEAGGVLK